MKLHVSSVFVKTPTDHDLSFELTTIMSSTGHHAGATDCSKDELKNSLDILEQCLPIGGEEWEAILQEHSMSYPG